MMADVLNITIILALAVTALVLFLGLFSMLRGGAFNARYGNRLMRLRVLAQGVAVVLIAIAMVVLAYSHMQGG